MRARNHPSADSGTSSSDSPSSRPRLLYLVNSTGIPQIAFMAVVLAVFLPALTYSLLTALWLLRTLVEITRFAGR